MSAVASTQRYTRRNRCPVCGGCEQDPRGQETRCSGFIGSDGTYAHCSRVAVGELEEGGTYAHRLDGVCRCGTTHGGDVASASRVVEAYDYVDEKGALLSRVVRKENPKSFPQCRPDGVGGWVWHLARCETKSCLCHGLPAHRNVLYRLPKLLAAAPDEAVFLCEGEKDVATLEKYGLLATTGPGGAEKYGRNVWRNGLGEHARTVLADRQVFIFADNDNVGREFAQIVAAELQPAVKSVDVFTCTRGKDITDHLSVGGDFDELVPLASAYPNPADPLAGFPLLQKAVLTGNLRIREMASRPVPWQWEGIATAGQIVALNGKPGGGKTTLLFLIAVARACCKPVSLLGHTMKPAPPGKYLVLIEGEQSEGSSARKLVKSVEALGVSGSVLDRVLVFARKDVLLGNERWKEVESLVAAGLVSDVAIDSLARVAGGEANSEEDQAEVFSKLQALIEQQQGAEEDKPTLWLVTHARKSGDGTSVDDVSGSAQRGAQADTIINVVGVKDGSGRTIASVCFFVKLREDPDDYPAPVQFAVCRGAGGGWQVTTTAGTAGGSKALDKARAAVLKLLATSKDLPSKDAIYRAITGTQSVRIAAVKELLESGLITLHDGVYRLSSEVG